LKFFILFLVLISVVQNVFHKIQNCGFKRIKSDILEYYKKLNGYSKEEYLEEMKKILMNMCDPEGRQIMKLLIDEEIIFDEFMVRKDKIIVRIGKQVQTIPKHLIR